MITTKAMLDGDHPFFEPPPETARRSLLGDGAAEIVCGCASVTADTLAALVASGLDLMAIIRVTGASVTCGGCLTRMRQLVGDVPEVDAVLATRDRLDDRHFRLVFHAPSFSPTVLPGASLGLSINVQGRRLSRSYTITRWDSTRQHLEIILRREENGVVSRWLCDYAHPGLRVRVSGPYGGQPLIDNEAMIFLAAGVGVTPALSRLRAMKDASGPMLLHWSVRADLASLLLEEVTGLCRRLPQVRLTLHDTQTSGRFDFATWQDLSPRSSAVVHVCGPPGYMEAAEAAVIRRGWPSSALRRDSFLPSTTGPGRFGIAVFDYETEPAVASSFHLRPMKDVTGEALAFLRQFYFENGSGIPYGRRVVEIQSSIAATGFYAQKPDELAFGAKLAWRNSARCIGRYFWQTLTVRDRRHVESEQEVFEELVDHLRFATNGGDLRPCITVFRLGAPSIRILNQQIILYAGYRQADDTVLGDPKNTDLTDLALHLGWRGAGTEFDILPVIIRIGEQRPRYFDLPRDSVLEVDIVHPQNDAFRGLGLKWFAVPAVSGMALDAGGLQYTAAPSSGIYMGTEIGSLNLSDPSRYDKLPQVAQALGLDQSADNPLWRDQALVEVNRAVIHSFQRAGVRIMDHHALSRTFMQFKHDETAQGRRVHGHWPWIVPPLSSNLSPVWHDDSLKKTILKPNYFYQHQTSADYV